MRWRMNTLCGGGAVCGLRSACSGVASFPGGGRLPYSLAGMPSLVGAREPLMGGWLLFSPEIKMFAPEHRYSGREQLLFAPEHLHSGGEQLLFAAEMLLFTEERLYSRRKHFLSGHEQLYLGAVHRLSRRGIFHSGSRIYAFYGEGFAEDLRALSPRAHRRRDSHELSPAGAPIRRGDWATAPLLLPHGPPKKPFIPTTRRKKTRPQLMPGGGARGDARRGETAVSLIRTWRP